MLKLPATTTQFDYIQLQGGLDLLTPLLKLKPGVAREATNWEHAINGGYTRIAGYERFDGRPAPSTATYSVITCAITGTISVGNTITGATSAATGVVLSITDDSLIAYDNATGGFVAGEDLTVSAVVQGSVTDVGGVGSEANYDAVQLGLAADSRRTTIAAVPGSGPIRGVARFAGVTYAWRDNAGATAMAIYKSSAGGWVSVALGFEIAFTAGSTEYVEGATISQGAVSAVVRRVALQSGTWAGTTAAGRIIVDSVTGGNFAAGAAAGGGVATLGGVQTAITLLPGGRVVTDTGNVAAASRIYGADGVNRGFEFDGTYYVPIVTGNTVDTPDHVLVHQGHLFYTFGESLQHSGLSTPYNWTALAGAAEYPLRETITALVRAPGSQDGGTLAVLMDGFVNMMYGTSAADFKIVAFDDSAGAKAHTAAKIGGQILMFDAGGVFSLRAAQEFGNFAAASLTMNIRPWLAARRNLSTASGINRERSQYRLFFSDGSGLYVTIVNGTLLGAMPVLFPNPATCMCQSGVDDAVEASFFGAGNGFVYQLDSGSSFDGAAIDHEITLAFASQSSPRTLKRYRKASLEVQGSGYTEFGVTYSLGYADLDVPQGSTPQTATLALASVYWDTFVWDAFVWDGAVLSPGDIEINGTAQNIALRIAGSSALYLPFTINSVILHYTPRRQMR